MLNRVPADARISVVTTVLSPSQSSAGVPPAPASKSYKGRRDACATLSQGERVVVASPAEVREKFRRVKPLKEISVTQRRWTLDVLNIVQRLCEVGTARCAVCAPSGRKIPALPPGTSQRDVPTNTFTTADTYAFTPDKLR
jgi:hypothetical protein